MVVYDQIFVNSVSGSVNYYNTCYSSTGEKGLLNAKQEEILNSQNCIFCLALTGKSMPVTPSPTNTPDPTISPTQTPTVTPTPTTV